MLFHSLEFLIFFPIVVFVYFIIPKRLKTIWLLAASYYFYMSGNVKHTVLIAFSTIITWISGLLIGRRKKAGKGTKCIVFSSLFLNLGILLFFKYSDFLLRNLNLIRAGMELPAIQMPFDIILPVGISFYTFQALGYTVDVYRGEIEPEQNLINYALFVSFFPQLVAGPIERSKNLLGQIRQIRISHFRKLFDYERIAGGLILMLWGFFQKLVIADRLCIFVDTVYQKWYFYGTVELVLATAAFSIQIYCDFASYSTIAVGAAQVLGFHLMVDHTEMTILAAALIFLLLVGLVREYRNETLDAFLARQSTWFRWLVIVILFSFLFLFGMYGPDYDESQFIYFQF